MVEAREETEQQLRGSVIEELLRREDDRRGRSSPQGATARHGSDCGSCGAVRGTPQPRAGPAAGRDRGRAPGRAWPRRWARSASTRSCPARFEEARKLAARLSTQATVGLSSRYATRARAAAGGGGGGARAGRAAGRRPSGSRGARGRHLPAAVPRLRLGPRGGAQLLRGHGGAAGALRRAVLDGSAAHARRLPVQRLQHEGHGRRRSTPTGTR